MSRCTDRGRSTWVLPRLRIVTSWPVRTSSLTSAYPLKSVPPMTNTRMARRVAAAAEGHLVFAAGCSTMTTTTAEFIYEPSTARFQDELWDVYRVLRDDHPVYRHPVTGTYALSRFDDVWRAVHDHDSFSSVVAEAQNLLPQMIYFDPPRHTAMRALVSRAFTPKRLAAVEGLVRQTARELCLEIAERGECELQHEFAAIVPSVVIARMIGVPDEHIPSFRTWTDSFLEIQGPQDFVEAAGKIYALFAELLTETLPLPRHALLTVPS